MDLPHQSESEETTSSHSKFKIDAKAKVYDEVDKRQQRKKTEDLYKQDRKKEDQLTTEKVEEKETITKSEKQHRHRFLARKPTLPPQKQHTTLSQRMWQAEPPSQDAITEQQRQQEQQITEQKSTQVDFSTPVASGDTQIVKLGRQTALFNQFKTWLGTGAPIASKTHQSIKKENVKTGKVDKVLDYIDQEFKQPTPSQKKPRRR